MAPERKARKPKVRAPYRMVSPPTWELARAAYLGGETARVVADRFDIGLNNLRQKIHREGWSKKALAKARSLAGPGGPDPTPRQAAAPPAPTSRDNLMDVVLHSARETLIAGRGAEASALLKALREYVVVVDDVSDAHDAIAWIDDACTIGRPELAPRLTESLALTQLRQMWAPLDPDDARWRDEARKQAAAGKADVQTPSRQAPG